MPEDETRPVFSRRNFLRGGGGAAMLATSGLGALVSPSEQPRREELYPYPPGEVLHFNPAYDSGWFYLASTEPDQNGYTFWLAAVRSLSREQIDTSAHLLYGITDARTGEHYNGFLANGALTEHPSAVSLRYVRGKEELVRFSQTDGSLTEFQVVVNLPFSQDRILRVGRRMPFRRPIIYESGDGVIPMSGSLESRYVSLVFDQGYWVDFQKFDLARTASTVGRLPSARAITCLENVRISEANHRWGSFMLTEAVGNLPAGTVGVYWELLDDQNRRQPGGFTNIDLLIPNRPQITRQDFRIEKIESWQGRRSYLRKWKLVQQELGIDLLFSTLNLDQESIVLGQPFYEGAVQVFDPANSGRKVGTGMLEQTHNESDFKLYAPLVSLKSKTP